VKKFLVMPILAAMLLAACGGNEVSKEESSGSSTESKETVQKDVEKKDEPTQEELDAKLKKEATDADFVELNVDNPPEGKKVKATGDISMVSGDGVGTTFTLTTKEGDGYGMYTINNFSLTDVQEGDKVTIYGTTIAEKADDGSPQINATIIE